MTGPELRARRLALGVERNELARVASLSYWTVKSLERGVRAGRPATWRVLEAALRVAAAQTGVTAEQVFEELTP